MKPPAAISTWLLRWFAFYGQCSLRWNFNTVRMLKKPELVTDQPLVFYLNHPSWWDPIVALFLSREFFADYQSYGAIDAAALQRYSFFKRLGFFPVERGTMKGARQFLYQARSILSRPNHALWLTPQGHFRDVRERPAAFENGLGHVAAFSPAPLMIPIAIEYVWWSERSPEILIAIGEPTPVSDDPAENSRRCENALASLQDELARASISRDPGAFTLLLDGSKRVSIFYDAWRKLKAGVRGQRFTSGHQSP